MSDAEPIIVELADEAATNQFGEDLALALIPGDCLALSGDLGVGKSTLARAFLRALADDDDLEVPSPTFTLVQAYALRIPVVHFDLYRLGDPSELEELGLDEALETGICLVEWPEMASGALPATQLVVRLEDHNNNRLVTLTGPKAALTRIRRSLAIRECLDHWGYLHARRRYLTGDASVRAYETVVPTSGQPAILMDWPRRPDGPVVLDGKTYPKVAHLAEDAYPFVALSIHLRNIGLTAPEVLRVDYEAGILLLEDLGQEGILDADRQPIPERYRESVACLAYLHGCPPRQDITVTPYHTHHIPDFDPLAMKMEARLLLDWYLPWQRQAQATEQERQDYLSIWDELVGNLEAAETNLLLRDFHSPNIIWRERELGVKRVAVIDFQDAMIGPTAYDLASIIQDARANIPPALAAQMMDDYIGLRRSQGNFNDASFRRDFALMSAQRNCKLAGLWVRLMQRDGKPGYLKHMPRTLSYLSSSLQHDALKPLRRWCQKVAIALPESNGLL